MRGSCWRGDRPEVDRCCGFFPCYCLAFVGLFVVEASVYHFLPFFTVV